jgi:hypothetical protein
MHHLANWDLLVVLLLFLSVGASLPCQLALSRHLREYWPELPVTIGLPKFVRTNVKHYPNVAFYKFLVLRQHRNLGDNRLSRLSDCSLLFLVLTALLFIVLGISIYAGTRY